MKVFRYWTTHPKSEGQCLWLIFATSGIHQEQLPAGDTYLFVTNAQHRSTCQPYSGIEPLRPLAQVLWKYLLVFSKHGCLIHLSCIRLQSYVFMLTRWHADMRADNHILHYGVQAGINFSVPHDRQELNRYRGSRASFLWYHLLLLRAGSRPSARLLCCYQPSLVAGDCIASCYAVMSDPALRETPHLALSTYTPISTLTKLANKNIHRVFAQTCSVPVMEAPSRVQRFSSLHYCCSLLVY